MDPIILETMNDIINQVDAREWNRVNEWGHRVVKKWKREKEKNEELKETYFQRGFDAGREEYEVDKEYLDEKDEEIERLKDEIKLLKGDDDDELDECFCCGKRFDSHEARYNMGESLRLKYIEYYGSENDDGDICPACIISKIIDK
tara:strand:+ start:310 stop:747 length:438 start_codon:yes stop_codon:yes gene_type:complete